MRGVFKADGPETGDRYCVSEWSVEPGKPSPGPQQHDSNEELFLVTWGTMSFHVADDWIDARAGTFIHVPAGVTHDFANGSERAHRVQRVHPGWLRGAVPVVGGGGARRVAVAAAPPRIQAPMQAIALAQARGVTAAPGGVWLAIGKASLRRSTIVVAALGLGGLCLVELEAQADHVLAGALHVADHRVMRRPRLPLHDGTEDGTVLPVRDAQPFGRVRRDGEDVSELGLDARHGARESA
jgi:mannose-6-phosphate isomerase-like protein (cupin superfamily)